MSTQGAPLAPPSAPVQAPLRSAGMGAGRKGSPWFENPNLLGGTGRRGVQSEGVRERGGCPWVKWDWCAPCLQLCSHSYPSFPVPDLGSCGPRTSTTSQGGSSPSSAGQGPKKLQAVQKAPLLLCIASYKALLLFSTISQFSAMHQLRAVALARRVCARQASGMRYFLT